MHNQGAPELCANTSLHKGFSTFMLTIMTIVDNLLPEIGTTVLINIGCDQHDMQVKIDSFQSAICSSVTSTFRLFGLNCDVWALINQD